jgi:hypothetical protein
MIGFAAQFLRKAAAAIAKVLHATWQGCRMHFARARRPVGPPCRVSLYCPKLPKLAAFLDEVETGVLAYMSFPSQHRAEPLSTNTCVFRARKASVSRHVGPRFHTRSVQCS